ncbi:MAG: sigma-54 dependent transcriptional regulator [Loktanella sp.]|nr:sigma-54 dependent transcriptional regulator [Loktanella sp.]MDO7622193.1 sigma-54 dependent transcriptional regulator [Loktanella sp.]MDO7626499.1 sigma-54 dependent transcriptional regulator [Loktanella sp.]MDO7629790.1 sigma-54 dependent transcriptional regulator [Loktanella sp.]MDO7664157.1 sigma-54 dependent transcriptional regulator [Loktanella sp.]
MTSRVLLVDDDPAIREALGQSLELEGLEPVLAGSYVAAKDWLTPDFDGVVVTDIRMPGRDGFFLLDHARTVDPDLPVILLTGEGDIPMAVKAMGMGAFDFLEKPCGPRPFLAVVTKALKSRALVLENRRLARVVEKGDAAERMLFGQSVMARELRAQVRQIAHAGTDALISGERGSGTSKVAEVIHLLSERAARPFVKQPSGVLDADGLGRALEAAEGGTLYLDEVGRLAADVQAALLGHIEAGLNLRILAGTTKALDEEVAAGRLQEDLFYHFDVMAVRIPSLRERSEDIPILFRHFVAQACEQANLPQPEIGQQVIAGLMAQDWPGNARALMNAAMRFAMGLSDAVDDKGQGLAEQMAQVERSLLIAALQRHEGRAGETALELQLPRKTFYDKLARHGLRAEDFRTT